MSICPDFRGHENEFTISDDLKNFIYRRSEVGFYPCSLPDPRLCATPQEFAHFTAFFGRMNKLLTPSNSDTPMTYAPTIVDNLLNPFFTKLIKLSISSNKIIDSRYEFVTPQTKIEYASYEVSERDLNPRDATQLHCTKQQIDLWKVGGCSEYLHIVFDMDREVFVMRRSYKKITEAFAEFGGIMKLLTTAAFVLYGWYGRRLMKASLATSTFRFTGQDGKFIEKFIHFLKHNQQLEGKIEAKGDIEGNKNLPNDFFNSEKYASPDQGAKLDAKILKEKDEDLFKKNKIISKNSKSDKKQKKSELECILTEFAKERSNANDLIDKINFLEFLQLVLLDENLKQLLPLILLKARHQKRRLREIQENKKIKIEKGDASNRRRPAQRHLSAKNTQSGLSQGPSQQDHQSRIESAFQALKDSPIDCSLKDGINKFVVKQLGLFFEEEDQSTPPLPLQGEGSISTPEAVISTPIVNQNQPESSAVSVERQSAKKISIAPRESRPKFTSSPRKRMNFSSPRKIRRRTVVTKQQNQAKEGEDGEVVGLDLKNGELVGLKNRVD